MVVEVIVHPTYIVLLGLLTAMLLAVVVSGLKGALGDVGDAFRELYRRSGEPWTWGAFMEPYLGAGAVFFGAAFGIAHPGSPWARWFYGSRKQSEAAARFPDEDPLHTASGSDT